MSEIVAHATILSSLPDLVLDGANASAYELHPDTKAEQSTTWRKQMSENNWVEGDYATSAVRANVTETLAVWANGPTADDVAEQLYELRRRLGLLTYQIELNLDGVVTTWSCQPADYSISEKHEYHHAGTALLVARIPRLPKVTITGTFGTLIG